MTQAKKTAAEPLLSVRGLRVDIASKRILRSVDFDVAAGELVVLMGANGSGKSTLALALAGHPRYEVAGTAHLDGQDLLALPVEARARAGLFLSFQAPPDIPGVKNNLFIRTALNAQRASRGEAEIDAFDFLGQAKGGAKRLGLPETMLGRPVNEGFSGGERKRNELLQLSLFKPRVALLDEIDSGLDVDGVRALVELIAAMRSEGTAFVVVSHYLHLIEMLEPTRVLRLHEGCIAESGDLELARSITSQGFAASAAASAAATVGA
ncbi:MAG: ABC transporter ATP-binding protein [Rubrivivax sp.]|jgi:Fe-S cluster assembly ATP-binding protein|nr:Fe-S cluster assembly ATPase SufC [Rubrivivax sp.]